MMILKSLINKFVIHGRIYGSTTYSCRPVSSAATAAHVGTWCLSHNLLLHLGVTLNIHSKCYQIGSYAATIGYHRPVCTEKHDPNLLYFMSFRHFCLLASIKILFMYRYRFYSSSPSAPHFAASGSNQTQWPLGSTSQWSAKLHRNRYILRCNTGAEVVIEKTIGFIIINRMV